MKPGIISEPDRRCMPRLFESISQANFLYRAALPTPVMTILSHMPNLNYGAAVEQWWNYNGQTMIFEGAEEARRVRKQIKNED